MRIKQKIYGDALKSMRIPILLHIISSCAEGLLTVFTATILGQFADSVFRLDFTLSARSAAALGLALFAMIAFLPAIALLANTSMLKHALEHDRMVLGRFLDKKYDSVLRYELGDIQNRLDWDPTNIRCYLVEYFDNGFMVLVTLAFLLFQALRLSPVYTLIVFALSLLKLAVPLAVRKTEGKYEKENREYASKRRSLETEITQRPCMVTLYGMGEAFRTRANLLYQAFFRQTERKSIRLSCAADAVSSFTGTFCTLAILLSGAFLAAEGLITPGTVAAMYGYAAVFHTLLENVGTLIRNTPPFRNTVERMTMFYEDAETEGRGSAIRKGNRNSSDIVSVGSHGRRSIFVGKGNRGDRVGKGSRDSRVDKGNLGSLSCSDNIVAESDNNRCRSSFVRENNDNIHKGGSIRDEVNEITYIRCENLTYAYGDRQALSRISFTIHRGEKTALCGPNGSGKSTLMKIMLGLLTGYGGSLNIDGRELSEWNPAAYRSHIAYAPQDPFLFEGTVLENIRIANPHMPEAALAALLDKLGIGYLADHQVAPGSGGLSGGEKQKVSIARACVRDTDFLFLDEPENNLDKDTLDWLCAFLRESGKTVVFISHDDRLTACADNVIMLQGC